MSMDTFANAVMVLAALAIVGVVVGALIHNWQHDRQHVQRLAELAAQRGWQYQSKPEGDVRLRLSGREAMCSWELVGRQVNTGSRGGGYAELVWRTEEAKLGEGEFAAIGPRLGSIPPNLDLSNGLVDKVMRFGLEQLLGVDLAGLTFHAVGSTLFQEKYIALARTADSARRLISPAVESQMLGWPLRRDGSPGPVIVADEYGVIVRARSDRVFSGGTDRVERMVNLGVAAGHALARA